MNDATVIQYTDDGRYILEYSESIILFSSACEFSVDFKHANSLSLPKGNRLNNWRFKFIFTDTVSEDRQVLTSSTDVKNDTVTITYFRWYGDGVENIDPLLIESNDGRVKFYVKMQTKAYESKPYRRTVNLSIWRVIPN